MKLYKKGLVRHILDEQSAYLYTQYLYHYQTEIRKYVYLIIISISEMIGAVIEITKSNIAKFSFPDNLNVSAHTKGLEHCVQVNNSILFNFQFSQSTIRELTMLEATGHSIEIIVITLIACLMLYLIRRMKGIEHKFVSKKMKFYIIIVLLSPLLIISLASVTSLIILSNFLFFLTAFLTLYFIISVFKRFLAALLQQAYQHLAQYGNNDFQLRQYRYFKYTMTVILNGYIIILIATILTKIPPIFTGVFFYGKCYFPFSLIPQYKPIDISDYAIEEYIKIMKLVSTVSKVFSCIGIIILISPIVILTLFVWGNVFYNSVRRKRTNQYRYNMESFNKRLIEK